MPSLIDGPNGPDNPDNGPYGPLQNELGDIRYAMSNFFDDPEQKFREFYEGLLSLPRSERFSNSAEDFKQELIDAAGSEGAVEALFPQNSINQNFFVSFIRLLGTRFLEAAEEDVRLNRNPEVPLAFMCLGEGLRTGFSHLGREEVNNEHILSCSMALMARLLQLGEKPDETEPEEIIKDAAYMVYHIDAAISSEPRYQDPEELNYDEMRSIVRSVGAIIAYKEMDISIGRGAELAGVSRPEFEQMLENSDINPRYGPSSVDELYDDDIDLMDD